METQSRQNESPSLVLQPEVHLAALRMVKVKVPGTGVFLVCCHGNCELSCFVLAMSDFRVTAQGCFFSVAQYIEPFKIRRE